MCMQIFLFLFQIRLHRTFLCILLANFNKFQSFVSYLFWRSVCFIYFILFSFLIAIKKKIETFRNTHVYKSSLFSSISFFFFFSSNQWYLALGRSNVVAAVKNLSYSSFSIKSSNYTKRRGKDTYI